jgi:hypothetical protein
MNPLPQIPTDNLYKFQAVAGSTLAILAVALAFSVLREQSARSANMAGELAVYGARAGTMVQIAKLVDSANARRNSLNGRKLSRYLDSLLVASDRQGAELDRLLRTSQEKRKEEQDLLILLTFLALIGFGYAQVAFNSWRKLHQSLQDRLLAAQVEVAELDVLSRRAQLSTKSPAHAESATADQPEADLPETT